MRIIAGTAKGKKLKVPKLSRNRRVRPLTDQVREALFNILGDRVPDACFLDLFAGTGAVGIEALSRGAKSAVFVELEREVVSVIRENLEITGLSKDAEVYCTDALRAINVVDKKGASFDIVFLGAPYDSPALEKALELIGGANIIKGNGVVVAEHRAKHLIADEYGMLKKARDARYGDTVLSFYKKKEN